MNLISYRGVEGRVPNGLEMPQIPDGILMLVQCMSIAGAMLTQC